MANGFIQITPVAKVQGETIANVFYYAVDLGLETEPSQAQMEAAIDSFLPTVLVPLRAVLPSDVVYSVVTARAFSVGGGVSEQQPVVRAVNLAGSVGTARDGNAHVANLAFTMGVLTAFTGSSGLLRDSRIAVGPLVNDEVAQDGAFLSAGATSGSWFTLRTAVTLPLDVDDTDDGLPCRVSHKLGSENVSAITAYRLVAGSFYRTYTGHLRGRMNRR